MCESDVHDYVFAHLESTIGAKGQFAMWAKRFVLYAAVDAPVVFWTTKEFIVLHFDGVL